MATTAPSIHPSSSTRAWPLTLTLRWSPFLDSRMISTSRSCSPDMARISGFSRWAMGDPSGRRSPWSVGMLPMGSSPSSSPWSCRAAGLNTVIRPSASQATMPSSRVSSSTWRNCSSRRSSDRRLAQRGDVAERGHRAGDACRRPRPWPGRWPGPTSAAVPLRRSPRTTPTDRRPLRRLATIGWSAPLDRLPVDVDDFEAAGPGRQPSGLRGAGRSAAPGAPRTSPRKPR